MIFKNVFIFFGLILAFISSFFASDFIFAQNKIEVTFFYGQGCPHCAKEEVLLQRLEKEYPIEVKRVEIFYHPENTGLYREMGKKYNVPEKALSLGTVPVLIFGDKYFLGYGEDETTGKEIENYLKSLTGGGESVRDENLKISFFGKVIAIPPQSPLILLAVLFGLADGINPCMFTVLLMLLAYLLAISSLGRMIKAGIVFGLSVFVIYFLLMLGIYEGISFFPAGVIGALKTGFGVVFVVVGLFMVWDLFSGKKEISFAIPKSVKPALSGLIKKSTMGAVVLLALFSSLVELPCTFALPLGYTTILSERGVSPYFYLILYNLFFVLPLFIIVGLAGFGSSRIEKIEKWKDKSKKIMRFVSGVLLLGMGIAFLFRLF